MPDMLQDSTGLRDVIAGIQQIGAGVADAVGAFRWYRRHFGLDIPIFNDVGPASLMGAYTGGRPEERHAILAANLQGGGALEIWQFENRVPRPPEFDVQLGDLGIFAARIKTGDIARALEAFRSAGLRVPGRAGRAPDGGERFFVVDPFGMIFDVVGGEDWFSNGKHYTGGVAGCLLGVSSVEKSLALYGDVLGYDRVLYDETGVFDDLEDLPGGRQRVRRMLLTHSLPRKGAFSPLYGSSRIELVQALERTPRRIFEGRYWGDMGFIHLCFDVNNMDRVREVCGRGGFPFVVDSGEPYDMGEAAGRFGYIEDPDGTLIEFVETYRLTLVKALKLSLNLKKRKSGKSLPRWMLKSLALMRVRD